MSVSTVNKPAAPVALNDSETTDGGDEEQAGRSGKASLVKGRVFLLLSTVAFALMGLGTRLVPEGFTSHEKVFWRSLIGTALLAIYFGFSRTRLPKPSKPLGLVARGVFGACSLLCFFYSIDTIGLAKATLYCYLYPVFAVLFAWYDLGEKPTPTALLAMLVAVTGAALTLELGSQGSALTLGDMAGIASGAFSGAAVTSIRRLTRTESGTLIVLSFTVFSTLLAAPFIQLAHPGVNLGEAALWLGMVGVTAVAAQILLTLGLRYVPAVEGGVLSLATVPLSALLAMVALNENLGLRFWLGTGMILMSAVTLTTAPSASTADPVAS